MKAFHHIQHSADYQKIGPQLPDKDGLLLSLGIGTTVVVFHEAGTEPSRKPLLGELRHETQGTFW